MNHAPFTQRDADSLSEAWLLLFVQSQFKSYIFLLIQLQRIKKEGKKKYLQSVEVGFVTEPSHPASQSTHKNTLHNIHILLNSRQTRPAVYHVIKPL